MTGTLHPAGAGAHRASNGRTRAILHKTGMISAPASWKGKLAVIGTGEQAGGDERIRDYSDSIG